LNVHQSGLSQAATVLAFSERFAFVEQVQEQEIEAEGLPVTATKESVSAALLSAQAFQLGSE